MGGLVAGVVFLGTNWRRRCPTLAATALEGIIFVATIVQVKEALDPLQEFQVVQRLCAAKLANVHMLRPNAKKSQATTSQQN